ncbi:flippase-like domain-containing protein [Geomonas nitrogeniifigens]|uniref:Flippase-like domain-containing protein n=1 Tax=Geomonas diazotrophica TaxID=2843197 RepID=A0ABX8JD56_9BACT|nr:lysylphosphatidylglycerol synthase transmembrane domain-containing protein [Geomonas nitrogeniifigens]QWV95946.1 flippase-like domain-containing protein [Geomonas nitrogeniifigens]
MTGRETIKIVLKMGFGLALLCFLLQRADMRRVLSIIVQVSPLPLLYALVAKVAGTLAQAARWQLLLQSSARKLRFLTLLRITLASRFINLFLPGQIGGDLYRVVGVYRQEAKTPLRHPDSRQGLLQSTGVVLLERYLSLIASLLMAGAAIAASGFIASSPVLSWFVVALLAATLSSLLPVIRSPFFALAKKFSPKWQEQVARTEAALGDVVGDLPLLGRFLGVSLMMNGTTILQIYFLAQALGLAVPLAQLAFFMPLFNLACAIPISINSLGVREASLIAFFNRTGLPQDKVTGLAFLLLVWLYLTDAPNGFLLLTEPLKRAPTEP